MMQIPGAGSNSHSMQPLGPTHQEIEKGLTSLKNFADGVSSLENTCVSIYEKYASFNMSTSSGEADALSYTKSLYQSGAFSKILDTVNKMASNTNLLGLSRSSIKTLFPMGGEAGQAISIGENFGNLLEQMQTYLSNIMHNPPNDQTIGNFVGNLEDSMYSWFNGRGTEYAGLTPTISEAKYLVDLLENSKPS